MNLKLNPEDILKKKFNGKSIGYDSSEVDAFLDKILYDYRTIYKILDANQAEINELKRTVDSLKADLRAKDDALKIETAKNQAANKITKSTDPTNLDPLDLLKKCSKYENALYDLGYDPAEISK